MPPLPWEQRGLRRVPRQARSRARVDAVVRALLDLVGSPDGRPAQLTTSDIAARAGIPIGSLYEYFVDLDAIVDAGVARALRQHEQILLASYDRPLERAEELVGVLVDSFGRLYDEEPALAALLDSTLVRPLHRQWFREHLVEHLRRVAVPGSELGALVERDDLDTRMDVFVAVCDTLIHHARRDPDVEDHCRDILRCAIERVSR